MKLQLTRPLVTLDIESTGVDAEKDKIIELCLLKRYPDGTTEIRTRRFNPGIAIPQEVIDIHGITDEMVKDEPEFKVFAKSILSWLQGCDIAFFGGNKFDIKILYNEFRRAGVTWDYMQHFLVDVGNIYKIKEPRTLDAGVMFYLNKEHVGAHGAESDTIATLDILDVQMEKYGDIPDNIEALALFSNFDRPVLDLSGKFRTDDDGDIVFNFGPKFGMKAKYNIDTLEWMLSKDFPADTCSVCYKLMEEFGGNNFDDNNY